ncbi:MAG: hypothetical protein HYT79_08650 [Elusimicrobia bacterium]|nr:hypothetical protein [Elusimicrobiota bacterium]
MKRNFLGVIWALMIIAPLPIVAAQEAPGDSPWTIQFELKKMGLGFDFMGQTQGEQKTRRLSPSLKLEDILSRDSKDNELSLGAGLYYRYEKATVSGREQTADVWGLNLAEITFKKIRGRGFGRLNPYLGFNLERTQLTIASAEVESKPDSFWSGVGEIGAKYKVDRRWHLKAGWKSNFREGLKRYSYLSIGLMYSFLDATKKSGGKEVQ